MALADTAELAVKLTLDDKLSAPLGRIEKRFGSIRNTANKALGVGLKASATVGALGIGLLVKNLKDGADALRADAVVAAQTQAVIKSTGGAAGVTAAKVDELAQKYSTLAGVQDDVVQSAENVLLTFTNIKADAFEPATQAALDFAAATGQDATSAAKLLGRALNDPARGMQFLRRAGVSLDAQTEKQIKSLVKQGKLYEAQKILLGEIAKRYGGVAKAQADADPSRRFGVAIERLQKALAKGLFPAIVKVQTRLTEFLSKPETIATIERLGNAIAGLFTDQNLNTVATGLETAAKAVGTAISAFNSLPPEIKALAIGAFTLNKVTGGAVGGAAEAFGKILGAGLQKIFAANVTVIGTNVTGAGGAGAAAQGASGVGGKIGGALQVAGLATVGVAIAQAFKDTGDQLASTISGGDQQIETATRQGFDLVRGFAFGPLEQLRRLPEYLDGAVAELNGVTKQTTASLEADTRSEGIATRTAFKSAQDRALVAFRAGERATLTGNSLQRTANDRLTAIKNKKTKFSVINNIGITTRVSVSELQRQAKYTSRVARSTSLSAS